MKLKISLSLCAVLSFLLSSFPASAADAVVPATVTMNSIRDEAQLYVSDTFYYEGTTLLFTNCVMFAGTSTNSAPQGLNQVTISVTIGNSSTSTIYNGSAQIASNGTWSCYAVVPTNSGICYVQVEITDVNTNSYIYPWKIMNHRPPL